MKLVRSVVLGVTVAAAVLAPTAAEAKSYRHVDATGDMFSTTSSTKTFTPAPDRIVGDIVSTTIRHKSRNVVIQVQYRDLVANSEIDAHYFVIRTSKMRRDVSLVSAGSFPAGRVQMTKANGTKVSCHVGRRIDYSLNTATVVVPRSCLGRPRWVKVGMAAAELTGLGSTDPQYVDDAFSTGTAGRYSPRVYR